MTYKFFLAGHVGFYNRGCEALVRGIVHALTARFGPCEFVAPSTDIEADLRQWPQAPAHGLRFVPFYKVPDSIRLWTRVARASQTAAAWWWPQPDVPPAIAREMASSDALIVTGGDVLSLDYSLGSLLRWVAQAEAGMRRGVPVVLWAASVGSFAAMPVLERRMTQHLRRYAVLNTRESHSQAYLQRLGLRQSVMTADPAFLMRPEALDLAPLLPPPAPGGMLGLNFSPVMARARARSGGLAALEADLVAFMRRVVNERGMSLLLVPHVDQVSGMQGHSDTAYMQSMLDRAGDLAARVQLLPHTLNAAQLKTALAACRCFIGARTHATIGALSSGVPTLSIAYSVKAKGINEDLFGHLRFVVETPTVSLATLDEGLQRLLDEEASIRSLLAQRIPLWRQKAMRTADLVQEALAVRRQRAAA